MNAIFAVNAVDGFGSNGGLPWQKNAGDLRRFKELTWGSTVVMGSGTWNSDMPKPLPGRRNIVLSSTLEDTRCEVYRGVTPLLMNLASDEKVWIIGGARVLWLMRYLVTNVYLTRIKTAETAPVVLDTAAYLDGFVLDKREEFGDHTFEIWHKK